MLSFDDARTFVRELGLKSQKEWVQWAKTERPANIPSTPNQFYLEEFAGLADWLGYEGRKYKRKKVAHPETLVFAETHFKSVPGLRRYYVSQDGRVLSAATKKPRLMKPHRNKATERWSVKLIRDNGKQTYTCVHRLVAMAWLPIPQKYVDMGLTPATLTVDHRDENQPHNNHVDNLQWMPRGPNTSKSNRSEKGRAAQKKRCRTVGREVVVRCLDDEDDVMTFHSINAFDRAWSTDSNTKSFPKTLERDGRKYRAEVVKQPDLEGEVWKTVPADMEQLLLKGAECSRIRVSSMGRLRNAYGVVRSLMGKKYPQIGVGTPATNLYFHRLVAAAFHPEQARTLLAAGVPVEDVVADHMAEDSSTDHRAANLQWVRRVDNLQFESGTRKRKRRV